MRCQILFQKGIKESSPNLRGKEKQTWLATLLNKKESTDKLWGIWQQGRETPHSHKKKNLQYWSSNDLGVGGVYAFVYM